MSRRRARRVAAMATAVLAGAALAGEARAADEPTTTTGLGIKLPPVEVKLPGVEIKVPSVEVDLSPVQVQVPSVEVKLPPVDVKLPPVEAAVPPLDVDEVPQGQAPAPSLNQDAPAAPRAPSAGDAPSPPSARNQDAPAREVSGASPAAPATSGEATGRDGVARGGSATRRDPTPATPRAHRERVVPSGPRRRERRLRDVVRSLSGCLGALRSIETRVLTLRAGGAARPPLSRRQVARRLDVGVQRVAAVERRGLDRLRERARADGCGAQSAPTVAVAPASTNTATPPGTPATSPRRASEERARTGIVGAVTGSLGATGTAYLTPSVLLVTVTSPPVLLLVIGGFLVGFALNWRRRTRDALGSVS